MVGDNVSVSVKGKTIKGLAANEAELSRLKDERARLASAHQSTETIDDEIENRQDVVDQLKVVDGNIGDAVGKELGNADQTRHYSEIKLIDTAIAKAREAAAQIARASSVGGSSGSTSSPRYCS